jgi:hypothetical protein
MDWMFGYVVCHPIEQQEIGWNVQGGAAWITFTQLFAR